jgi:hypothetical protein
LSAVGLVAAITAGASFSIDWYRHRFVRSNADLIAVLPGGSGTRFFVHAALLRQAGILDALGAGKLSEDPDFKRFGEETHFDYRRDMDALGGSLAADRADFLVRGRFDRGELWKYAAAHGGNCNGDWCRMPAVTPGRWASFALPQPDLLALAVGPQPSDPAARFHFEAGVQYASPSSDPVWVELSPKLLQRPAELPLSLQIFAVSLQSAAPVILSVGAVGRGEAGAFLLKLDAQFPTDTAADTVRKQLELETKSLSLALARQNHGSDPKDFTGLLASGQFQAAERHILGRWLIRPELIHALE